MRFFRYVIFLCYGTPFRQLVFIGTLFGLCPLASNMYFAWQAYFVEPAAFGKTVHDCYVTAGTAFGATLANLIGFALFGLGTKKTLFIIILQSIAVITAFAGIYQGHGLSAGVVNVAPETLTTDEHYWTSLYFSIVTWTTLGYGDFVPPADIRMVAAAEALLGYFTFGTIVGLLTSMIGAQTNRTTAPPVAAPLAGPPPIGAPAA
jgi:hypothetical protein